MKLIVASRNFHLSQGLDAQFQNGAPLTFIEFSPMFFAGLFYQCQEQNEDTILLVI